MENFTAYCDRKNIGGTDRSAIVKQLLLGEAKFWYNELEYDVRDHWDQFSEAFEENISRVRRKLNGFLEV